MRISLGHCYYYVNLEFVHVRILSVYFSRCVSVYDRNTHEWGMSWFCQSIVFWAWSREILIKYQQITCIPRERRVPSLLPLDLASQSVWATAICNSYWLYISSSGMGKLQHFQIVVSTLIQTETWSSTHRCSGYSALPLTFSDESETVLSKNSPVHVFMWTSWHTTLRILVRNVKRIVLLWFYGK